MIPREMANLQNVSLPKHQPRHKMTNRLWLVFFPNWLFWQVEYRRLGSYWDCQRAHPLRRPFFRTSSRCRGEPRTARCEPSRRRSTSRRAPCSGEIESSWPTRSDRCIAAAAWNIDVAATFSPSSLTPPGKEARVFVDGGGLGQEILNREVSMYHWPPVYLVWNLL
jgi:hypothetical protein